MVIFEFLPFMIVLGVVFFFVKMRGWGIFNPWRAGLYWKNKNPGIMVLWLWLYSAFGVYCLVDAIIWLVRQ